MVALRRGGRRGSKSTQTLLAGVTAAGPGRTEFVARGGQRRAAQHQRQAVAAMPGHNTGRQKQPQQYQRQQPRQMTLSIAACHGISIAEPRCPARLASAYSGVMGGGTAPRL